MTLDAPDDRSQRAWQSLPGETPMPANDVRLRAAMFEARGAKQMTLARAAFLLVLIANVLEIVFERSTLERLGSGLTIVALLFVAFTYRRRRRSARSASAAVDSLQFYRAELARQRDEIRHFWWRYALPFVPGLALSIGPAFLTPRAGAQYGVLALLFAVLLAGIALINHYEARKLQAEIDELES